MKTILAGLIFSVLCLAERPVAVGGSITVKNDDGTTRTYSITLSPGAVESLARHIDATGYTDDKGVVTRKFADAGVLIIQHLNETLIAPMVAQYPPPDVVAATAAEAAAKAAKDKAIADASAGVIIAK